MPDRCIVKLSDEDRDNNHTPDWAYDLSHTHDVFVEDFGTGELIQVVDLRPLNQQMQSTPSGD